MFFGVGHVGRQMARGVTGSGSPAGATLDLTFMYGTLDPSLTFTRASTATYFDASGTMQTAATNAPRFDNDPVTHAALGLLIEEQRTNVTQNSSNLAAGTWAPGSGTVIAPVVTGNQSIAPDGTTTAARIVYPAVSTAPSYSVVYCQTNPTAAVYTFSMYLKGAVGGERTYIEVTDGSVVYYRSLATLTTSWQRFSLVTSALTTAVWYMSVGTDLRDGSQSATSAQTIYAWGAQLEAGAFPTSYIPTTGAAVTRSQDFVSTPLASWYSTITGTIVPEAMLPNNGNVGYRGIFEFDMGNVLPDIRAYTNTGTASMSGNVDNATITFGTITPGVPFKLGATYSAAGTAVALNGVMGTGTATVSTPATYTTLRLGCADPLGANVANGYIRRVRYWPRVLSDAEMQSVTT